MSMTQSLAPHLPYLRRYARALTGSQRSGDAHVRAALTALLEGEETLAAGVALYPGIHTVANCHGFGSCGTCRVLITKGMENTSPRGILEAARMAVSLAYIGNESTMRLACQTKVKGDITVTTCPPLNLFGESFYS